MRMTRRGIFGVVAGLIALPFIKNNKFIPEQSETTHPLIKTVNFPPCCSSTNKLLVVDVNNKSDWVDMDLIWGPGISLSDFSQRKGETC